MSQPTSSTPTPAPSSGEAQAPPGMKMVQPEEISFSNENEKIANVVKINLEAVDKATKFLRAKVPTEEGFDGKRRVEFFKGVDMVKTLLASKYSADCGDSEAGAMKFISVMGRRGYFERSEITKKARVSKNQLCVVSKQQINVFRCDDSVYVWKIMESPFWNIVIGAAVIIGGFLLCMLPLWPSWMRTGVQYGSYGVLGLIGLLFGILILRAIVFCLVYGGSFGKVYFWIYPNLNEEVDSIMDSFRPMYSLEFDGAASAPAPAKKDQ